jgi:hypothetical protein
MFMEFEFYNEALEILSLNKPEKNLRYDSLKMELMSLSEKYYDLLTLIEDLEKNYSEEVDFSFGLAYLKALTYYKLKQNSMAVTLLNNLLKIRPDYRSASVLLNHILEEIN